jgi:hypothetical protein
MVSARILTALSASVAIPERGERRTTLAEHKDLKQPLEERSLASQVVGNLASTAALAKIALELTKKPPKK